MGVFVADDVAEFVLQFIEDAGEFIVGEWAGERVAGFSAALEGEVAENGRSVGGSGGLEQASRAEGFKKDRGSTELAGPAFGALEGDFELVEGIGEELADADGDGIEGFLLSAVMGGDEGGVLGPPTVESGTIDLEHGGNLGEAHT